MQTNWIAHTLVLARKMVQPATQEKCLAVSYKTEPAVSFDTAVVPLGIYFRETETSLHIKTCTSIFIAAALDSQKLDVFLIAKN